MPVTAGSCCVITTYKLYALTSMQVGWTIQMRTKTAHWADHPEGLYARWNNRITKCVRFNRELYAENRLSSLQNTRLLSCRITHWSATFRRQMSCSCRHLVTIVLLNSSNKRAMRATLHNVYLHIIQVDVQWRISGIKHNTAVISRANHSARWPSTCVVVKQLLWIPLSCGC